MIFSGLYVAYVSIILIWCMLGAILNPEKFLPLATGAFAIIFCIFYLYTKLKNINQTLTEVVDATVTDQLRVAMFQSISKKNKEVAKIISQVESMPQVMFNKALNAFMHANNLQTIPRSLSDEILNGNAGAIAKLLNTNVGIDYNISLGLVGVLKNDPVIIVDSVYKISEALKVDPEINVILAELILNKYNPDTLGKRKVDKSVILSIKKLVYRLFPQFESEILDSLLQVAIELDVEPLKQVLAKFNLPVEMLDLIIAFSQKDNAKIQNSIHQLSQKVMPEYVSEPFYHIQKLVINNVYGDVGPLAKLIGIKHKFVLDIFIAFMNSEDEFVRHKILKALENVAEEANNEKVKQGVVVLQNFYLAFDTLIHGSSIDIPRLASKSMYLFDSEKVKRFYKACNADCASVKWVLKNIGLDSQSKIILQFKDILIGKPVYLGQVAHQLGIHEEFLPVLNSLVALLIDTTKYAVSVAAIPDPDKLSENINVDKANKFKRTIRKDIRVLAESGAIDVLDMVNPINIRKVSRKLNFRVSTGQAYKEELKASYDDIQKLIEVLERRVVSLPADGFLKAPQMKQIVNDVFKFLNLQESKQVYIMSIVNLVMFFYFDLSAEELAQNKEFIFSVGKVAELFEIKDEELIFIIDMMTFNPFRVFAITSEVPKINPETLEIKSKFNESRFVLLSEALKMSPTHIRQFSALWMYNQDLVLRGERFVEKLAKETLGVEPKVLKLIAQQANDFYSNAKKKSFDDAVTDLVISLLDVILQKFRAGEAVNEIFTGLNSKFMRMFNKVANDSEVKLDNEIESYENLTKSIFDVNNDFEAKTAIEFLLKFIKIVRKKDLSEIMSLMGDSKIGHLLKSVFMVFSGDIYAIFNALIFLCEEFEPNVTIVLKPKKNQIVKEYLFLPVMMLLTGVALNETIFNESLRSDIDEVKKATNQESFDTFVSKLKKYVKNPLELDDLKPDMSNMLSCLLESGFFDGLAKKALSNVIDLKKLDFNPASIFGIMIGQSLNNRDLIRSSLINLVNGVDKDKIKGLLAMICKDPKQEKALKAMMKTISVNPKLGINLLELVNISRKGDKYNAALNVCKRYCGNAAFVSSFVALLKGDISRSRMIIEALNLKYERTSLILACATGQLGAISAKLPLLNEKLKIGNLEAMKQIMLISTGEMNTIKSLCKSGRFFKDPQNLQFLEAVITLMQEGVKRRRYNKSISFKKIHKCCKIISHRLGALLFGQAYINDEKLEEEKQARDLSENLGADPYYDDDEGIMEFAGMAPDLFMDFEGGKEESQSLAEEDKSDISIKSGAQTKDQHSNSNKGESLHEKLNDMIVKVVLASLNDLPTVSNLAKDIRSTINGIRKHKRQGLVEDLDTFTEGISKIPAKFYQDTKDKTVVNMNKLKTRGKLYSQFFNEKVSDKFEEMKKIKEEPRHLAFNAYSYVPGQVQNQNDPSQIEKNLNYSINELIDQVGCTFTVAKFRPLNQIYYICKLEGSEQEFNIWCVCISECQYDMFLSKEPRLGKVICECGKLSYIQKGNETKTVDANKKINDCNMLKVKKKKKLGMIIQPKVNEQQSYGVYAQSQKTPGRSQYQQNYSTPSTYTNNYSQPQPQYHSTPNFVEISREDYPEPSNPAYIPHDGGRRKTIKLLFLSDGGD